MICTLPHKVLLTHYIESKLWRGITLFLTRREYCITHHEGRYLLSERINEVPGKLASFNNLYGIWKQVSGNKDYPTKFADEIVDLILAQMGGE